MTKRKTTPKHRTKNGVPLSASNGRFMKEDASIRLAAKTASSPTGCLNFTGYVGRDGYGWFRGAGEKKSHRAAYAIHKGPIPPGAWVLHTCDNRKCVLPEHLYLGDHAANVRDMVARGRHKLCGSAGDQNGSRTRPDRVARGSRNGFAVLTEELVLQIRIARANGATIPSIASHFGVTVTNISRVCRRKIWRHVGGPMPSQEMLTSIRSAAGRAGGLAFAERLRH